MGATQTWEAADHYFSGQGVVLMAKRSAAGAPLGLRPCANVSSLKLQIATSVVEHKESHTGQRSLDLRLVTETKGTVVMTMESWDPKNLEAVLRGVATPLAASSVTAEAITGYPGLVTGLQHINVSTVVINQGGTPLTEFAAVGTPWDYKVNYNAGSIEINDGSVDPSTSSFGNTITALTVGATTQLTVANTCAVGDPVIVTGVTGTGASAVNGQHTVLAASSTGVTIDAVSTGLTLTVTGAKLVFGGIALTANYSYGAQSLVDTLVTPTPELWLRFEGLNTASANSPVVVDIFRVSTDPLKELDLISDTVGAFELQGSMLLDPYRPVGTSKFFQIRKLAF